MGTELILLNADNMAAIATKLKDIVTSHKLYTDIEGKKYVWVEGWCLGGNRLGLTALPKTPIKLIGGEDISVRVKKYSGGYEDIIIKNEIIYGCECDIIKLNDGAIIGHGYSICSNIEANKVKWQEYAIASMSQTRAISRAYRNTIGFVMKLMGNEFVATPAEEMDFSNGDDKELSEKAGEIVKKWGGGNNQVKTPATMPQKETKQPPVAPKPFQNDTTTILPAKVREKGYKWNIADEGIQSLALGLCNTEFAKTTDAQKQMMMDFIQEFGETNQRGIEYKRNPEGKIISFSFPE